MAKNYRALASGRFQTTIRRGGKDIPGLNKTFNTELEAKQYVIDIMKNINHFEAQPQDRTLLNVMHQYLQSANTQKLKSNDSITNRINLIVRDHEAFANTQIGKITVVDLDKFKEALYNKKLSKDEVIELRSKSTSPTRLKELNEKRAKPANINQYLSLLNQTYKYGIVRLRMPITNIVVFAGKEKVNNARDRVLSVDEQKILDEHLQDWMKPIVYFALESAARIGEIMKMQYRHVNFKDRKVELLDTKNGTDRTIPLSLPALAILKKEFEELSNEDKLNKEIFVFKGKKGSASQSFAMSCKKANIENMTFHDLRHTAITLNLVPKISNIMTLQKITGHKTISQLARYYNPTHQSILDALDS